MRSADQYDYTSFPTSLHIYIYIYICTTLNPLVHVWGVSPFRVRGSERAHKRCDRVLVEALQQNLTLLLLVYSIHIYMYMYMVRAKSFWGVVTSFWSKCVFRWPIQNLYIYEYMLYFYRIVYVGDNLINVEERLVGNFF